MFSFKFNKLPPVSFWLLLFLTFFRLSLIFRFFDLNQRLMFTFICLAFVFYYLDIFLYYFFNSIFFQYWFFYGLTLENFFMRFPLFFFLWCCFFFSLSIVWFTYLVSEDIQLTLTVVFATLFLYHFYFSIQKMLLDPKIAFCQFEIQSANDITWDSILKAISSFSSHYSGFPTRNKLGERHLSRSFPYIAKRFMFRKAMGKAQSFVTEYPDALKMGGAIVTTAGLGIGTLLTVDVEKQKIAATHASAEATKYAAEATKYAAEAKKYVADKNFEAIKYKADKEWDAAQLRLHPTQSKDHYASQAISTQEVKAPSLFIDSIESFWENLF